MTTYPTPAGATRADARQRAVRTFLQGLVTDVTAAASFQAAVLLGDVHWTRAWAVTAGGLVLKSALVAAASYVHARVSPPVPAS